MTVADPGFQKEGVKKFDRSKQFSQRGRGKRTYYGKAATVVRKPSIEFEPITPTPTEQIKRVNLTGLTDDDLFGPAFLFEEPEIFTEKKSIPTNPVQIEHGYPVDGYYDGQIDHGYPVDDYYEETYDDEDNPAVGNCFDCGELLYGD